MSAFCIHGRFTERPCEECEDEAREHRWCKETKDKLETALRELEGFARRNEERARKAMEHAKLHEGVRDFDAAEARLHEAARVYQVIKMRVAEALS